VRLMNSNQLKEWTIKNNVRQRTIEHFWSCLENYRREEPNEFQEWFVDYDKTQVSLQFEQVALKIRNWDDFDSTYNENNEFIDALIVIEHRGENTAEYTLRFNFAGDAIDDFFTMY
jgi:hypothetical protein